MSRLLRFENVFVDFTVKGRAVPAVRGITLDCPAGSVTGLIGESGSGKSVLGQSVMRLLPSSAVIRGDIYYGDMSLTGASEFELRRLRGTIVGFIPQNPDSAFDPLQSVGRQIAEPLRMRGMSCKEADRAVRERLRVLGFDNPDDIAAQYPFRLSGGMCQRALCALGTIAEPEFLIADEPTKGLDVILRKQVVKLFSTLRNEGRGMLVITHDLTFAEYVCDYVAVMKAGVIVEAGPTKEIFMNPGHAYTKLLLDARPGALLKARRRNGAT